MFIENFEETQYYNGKVVAVSRVSSLRVDEPPRLSLLFEINNRRGAQMSWAADISASRKRHYRISRFCTEVDGKTVHRVSVKNLDKTPVIRWDFSGDRAPSLDAIWELVRVRLIER